MLSVQKMRELDNQWQRLLDLVLMKQGHNFLGLITVVFTKGVFGEGFSQTHESTPLSD